MIDTTRSTDDLLKDLGEAVRVRDRERATEIEQAILQRLLAESIEHDKTEMRVRAIMQDLDQPLPQILKAKTDELSLDGELSAGSSTNEVVVYPVFFGTNRKANEKNTGFTGGRSCAVTLGRVDVSVPDAHKFGETGTSWFAKLKRTRLRGFDFRDDCLRVNEIKQLVWQKFIEEVQDRVQSFAGKDTSPQALVFIHGYNVKFEEAAIRTAQIGVDLKVEGAAAFFSWPSQGDAAAYPVDEATIEASEQSIVDFLLKFTANCGADKVHLIAHSMGNRGLLRALQRIAASVETQGKIKFGQIILAAPDLDRDLFLDLAHLYPTYSERTTLYASDADLPVHLSSKLHGAPRAGYFVPYTVAPNIDTVCVPDFDVDLLFHSYFAQAEALLYDICDLLTDNRDPGKRQRITSMSAAGQTFWRIKK
jgi:esterase/lipase superfamily enzyme